MVLCEVFLFVFVVSLFLGGFKAKSKKQSSSGCKDGFSKKKIVLSLHEDWAYGNCLGHFLKLYKNWKQICQD